MTVPMSMNNTRADFMISDAALPQRVDAANTQADQFQRILTEVGSVVKTTNVESAEYVEVSEFTDFSQMDDLQLAMAVVKGDVDIKDIPAERITPKFLVMLAIAKRLAKRDKDDDEEEFQNLGEKMKSSVFNSTQTGLPQDLMQLMDGIEMDILEILNRVSIGETEKKDIVGGISELMESMSEGLPVGGDYTQTKADNGSVAEIVDELVQMIAEVREQVESETAETENADTFVLSESAKTTVVDETLSDETRTILEKAMKSGEIEQPRVVESTEKSEVKTETENPVKPNANAAESRQLDDRAKQLAEELEMLRNAKAAKSAPKEFEVDAPKADEAKPVQASNPLMADSPVVFTREDGSEISVKPSEIVSQAMEVVTKAVSEDKTDAEYSITLNPEELGRITVKLTKAADGAVSVTIAAENANTQRILERNSELMQSNLRENGIQLESWQTVSESQQETTAQDYNGSSKNPYYREENPQAEEDSEDKSFAEIIASM